MTAAQLEANVAVDPAACLAAFLATRPYLPRTAVKLSVKRFSRIAGTAQAQDGHDGLVRFLAMRAAYRALEYDTARESMERRVVTDAAGRPWTCEAEHRRRWVLVFRPRAYAGLHEISFDRWGSDREK